MMKFVAIVRSIIQRVNTWLYVRRMERLFHLSDPPEWKVFLEAAYVVAHFWAVTILVFIASLCMSLFYQSNAPLTVGGYIITLMALIFGLFVNAEAGFIYWLEKLTGRLMPNESARYSTGYTEVNRLIGKWRKTGAIFRGTVTVSNVFLCLAGIALTLLA